jgi:hypothetical protein
MSTQTSPIKTTREDRRVITIPEARPPRRWGLIIVVALAVLCALVLGALAGSISQRGTIRDRDARISAAQEAARVAADASNQALAQASSAAALVEGLRADLGRKVEALALLHARGHESAALVREMRARVVATRGRLAEARHQAARLTGSPLSDGRYAVRLVAAGALESPPRVIFDLGTWLRGRAARKAAIADGVIGPHGHLSHHRYFRNHAVAWRVMSVASDARVSVQNRHGHPVYESNIIRLQDILFGTGPREHRIQRDPFWIVVRSGTVVSIQRQAYP